MEKALDIQRLLEELTDVHRGSLHTVKTSDSEDQNILVNLILSVFLLAYFIFLPLAATILVNWIVFFFTAQSFYHASWMMPLLLGFGSFVGGVLIRQKIEDGTGGLAKITLGLLGLMLFAYLTYLDIHQLGGIYSQYMPMFLRPPMVVLIYSIPGIGFGGMLFYKFFTLKTYS